MSAPGKPEGKVIPYMTYIDRMKIALNRSRRFFVPSARVAIRFNIDDIKQGRSDG